ncbi:MAG: hypothetical protein DRP35_07040 [Candidatus Zixiibacteriota bacterium]|nr:MAG: hypothetical protein DRP35_07040 [candidate division Zixibacteria bacterium]
MNLLILNENDQLSDNQFIITDHRANHILNILKLSVGSQLNLGLIDKFTGIGIIEKIDNKKITITIKESHEKIKALQSINIICALPRPQTIKKILFIAGMTAIRNIFFIRANRVEKSFFQSPLLDKKEYMKYLIEGMSQGKQIFLPNVSFHTKFKPFFEDYLPDNFDKNNNNYRLLPDMEASSTINSVYKKSDSNILLAIGPEGGWVPFEIEMMKSLGFKKFKLSDYTLRVEHALMASISQLELINTQ